MILGFLFRWEEFSDWVFLVIDRTASDGQVVCLVILAQFTLPLWNK